MLGAKSSRIPFGDGEWNGIASGFWFKMNDLDKTWAKQGILPMWVDDALARAGKNNTFIHMAVTTLLVGYAKGYLKPEEEVRNVA